MQASFIYHLSQKTPLLKNYITVLVLHELAK